MVPSSLGFHVVRHYDAGTGTIRPETYEWNPLHTLGFHRQQQKSVADILNRCVHGPLGKGQLSPITCVELLNQLSHRQIGERSQEIIKPPENAFETAPIAPRVCIVLQAKIVDNLGWIEWQPKLRTDRKSTRLNSSHSQISYAVFCLKKKKKKKKQRKVTT